MSLISLSPPSITGKVTRLKKGGLRVADFIRNMNKVGIDKLYYMVEDKNTPKKLKRKMRRLLECADDEPDELDEILELLYENKGEKREMALANTITLLKQRLDDLEHDDFSNRMVVTLLYRCLHGVKKGSATEKQYALEVISLLSVMFDDLDKMSEMYREVLSEFSAKKFLKRAGPDAAKMLTCLGLVTFFGANDQVETQVAMKVIWDFIYPNPDSGYDVNRNEHSPEVLSAAIRSWSFLLTSMEGWRLHRTYWKGAISFFIDLLEHHDDNLVHEAAGTALALIFEVDSLDKFWDQVHDFSTSAYSQLRDTVRVMLLDKLKEVKTKDLTVVRRYLETLQCPIAEFSVCGNTLELSSGYGLIQLKFLMSFLGDEFEMFVVKEQKLWNFFEFDPVRDNGGGIELYKSTTTAKSNKERDPRELKIVDPKDMPTATEIRKQRVRNSSVTKKAQTKRRAKQHKPKKFDPIRDNSGGIELYKSTTTAKSNKERNIDPRELKIVDPEDMPTATEIRKQRVRNSSVTKKAQTKRRAKEQKPKKFDPVRDDGGGIELYKSTTTAKSNKVPDIDPDELEIVDPKDMLTATEIRKQRVRNSSVTKKARTKQRANDRLNSNKFNSYEYDY